MEKYISVEALENILKFVNGEIERVCNDGTLSAAYVAYDGVRDRLRGALLSARSDVAPVRHGTWVTWAGSLGKCSVCGYEYTDLIECNAFCGNCGARMDADE